MMCHGFMALSLLRNVKICKYIGHFLDIMWVCVWGRKTKVEVKCTKIRIKSSKN